MPPCSCSWAGARAGLYIPQCMGLPACKRPPASCHHQAHLRMVLPKGSLCLMAQQGPPEPSLSVYPFHHHTHSRAGACTIPLSLPLPPPHALSCRGMYHPSQSAPSTTTCTLVQGHVPSLSVYPFHLFHPLLCRGMYQWCDSQLPPFISATAPSFSARLNTAGSLGRSMANLKEDLHGAGPGGLSSVGQCAC